MQYLRPFRSHCIATIFFCFAGVIRPILTLGILILILIQFLQPFFFLTSDNLQQLFPVWTEAGRHLYLGENPWVSAYLYGGNYPLYRDPTFLSCLHPLVLSICLLANTPLRYSIIDLFASLQILGSCVAMAALLLALQRRKMIQLASWQTVVLSLSYGFSGFNVLVGSFWFFYLANQVALPLYLTGFLLHKRVQGILLIMTAGIHAFLSGVPSSYLFTLIACSFFACVQCFASRDVEVLRRWIFGQILAALLLSPSLYFSISGFLDSVRGQGSVEMPADLFRVPFLSVASGWFLAGFGGILGQSFTLINTSLGLSHILFGTACSWWLIACLIPLCRRFRSQNWGTSALLGMAFSLLLITRPGWMDFLVHSIPFLKSSRWPFRETFLLIFFLHLWMAFYIRYISKTWLIRLLIPGTLLLVISFLCFSPEAFVRHQTDRRLLFSGIAENHWARYKMKSPEEVILIPLIDSKMMAEREKDIPLTLVGAGNYPSFFKIKSVTGYSSTPPRSSLPMGNLYFHPVGYVTPEWLPILQKFGVSPKAVSRVEQLDPTRVTVDDGNQHFSTTVRDPQKSTVAGDRVY